MTELLTLLDLVSARSPELHVGNCIGADLDDGETIPAVGADLLADSDSPQVAADIRMIDSSVAADLVPVAPTTA